MPTPCPDHAGNGPRSSTPAGDAWRRDGRRPVSFLVVVVLAVALAVGGCGDDGGSGTPSAAAPTSPTAPSAAASSEQRVQDGPSKPRPRRRSTPEVEGLPVPPDLARKFTRLLDRRAEAVLSGDRESFLAGVDQSPGFLVTQQGYYENLRQLPLATFEYTLDRSSLVRSGESYWVVVEVALQLAGYDSAPVRTLDRLRFSPREDGSGGYVLSSMTDREWEQSTGVQPQPWDLVPIEVRTGDGVLGIFDAESVRYASRVLGTFERGVADVRQRVPYPWDGRVVVYALSDLAYLQTLEKVPGGDPEDLDGVALGVPAGPGDPTIVGHRIALNPRLLGRPGAARDRLVRHELTHVAVGTRDDEAPVWLSEGLAEWVSVQAVPRRERRVADSALRRAPEVRRMPGDRSFNDQGSELHYAVAWWSVEYLARRYGASAPWTVLDAFSGPAADLAPDRVLRRLLRLDADQLARRGAALMRRTYTQPPRDGRPGASSTPEPSGSGSPDRKRGGREESPRAPSPSP